MPSADNRPHLLYFLHNFHNRAGTEEHTKLLGAELSEDFKIAYLFPQGGTLVLRFQDSGEELTFPGAQMPWPLPPIKDATINSALKTVFEKFKPDLIHIQHTFNWPLGILAQLEALRCPLVMSFHEYFSITPFFTMQGTEDPVVALSSLYIKQVFGQDIREPLIQRIEFLRKEYERVPTKIVPSNFLSSVLQKVYPADYKVIPHGIRPFVTSVKKYEGSRLRFGYLGSLLPQKGWIELLKGWQLFSQKHPEAELHLFGGAGAPKNPPHGVTFRGVYEQQDLPNILSDFHVGVIPSVFAETFSLVLSEMQLAGLPVATSNLGAFKERVEPEKTGVTFNPFDPHAVAAALEKFVADDSWKDWEIPKPRLANEMAEEYKALYHSLL